MSASGPHKLQLPISGAAVNALDQAVLGTINLLSRQSWAFDRAVQFLSGEHLLKGAVLSAALWWAWFRPEREPRREPGHSRRRVVATVLGVMAALLIGKLIQLALPFRARPMHTPELGLLLPYGAPPTLMSGWTSFPSDHAIIFIGLCAGLFFISRRAGWLCLAYVLTVVLLPRLYLLLHYPTDLLAGAAIGATSVIAANHWLPHAKPVDWAMAQVQQRPEIAYPVMFVLSYQIAVLFDNVRAIALAAARAVG